MDFLSQKYLSIVVHRDHHLTAFPNHSAVLFDHEQEAIIGDANCIVI